MRKLLVLAVAALLLLSGCSNQQAEETPSTAEQTTAATEPTGAYIPTSELETETKGAVRVYDLQGQVYSWISQVGGEPVVGRDEANSEMTLLTGLDGVLAATAQLPFSSNISNAGNQSIYGGFAFYDSDHREMIFLDSQLKEADRVKLPEGIQGAPACSPDGRLIYYCLDREIRCMDVELGISRLIKSHSCLSQTVLGVYAEGEIIACRVVYEDGSKQIVYISAEDGQTIASQNLGTKLSTYQDAYLLMRKDGIVPQIIFGTDNTEAQILKLEDDFVFPALELSGVMGAKTVENGVLLSFYEIPAGVRTAAAELAGVTAVKAAVSDSVHSVLWLLVTLRSGEDVLLRWDPAMSAVENDAVYSGTLYTAKNPDKESLKTVQKRADDLSREHGVTIRLLDDATKRDNGRLLEVEYQPDAITSALDELERMLQTFPENFLYKSVSTKIRICIVRSIAKTQPYDQFWYDGDAYILLTPGGNVEESFMKAVSYVVESHVLGNSPLVDSWSELNPGEFIYGDPSTYSDEYLSGDGRLFVDRDSMTSVTEDRSRIFWQAMQPDNGEMFASEVMQNKLLQLCRAIRDAWGLERKTDVYQWEQYLTESIAYKK